MIFLVGLMQLHMHTGCHLNCNILFLSAIIILLRDALPVCFGSSLESGLLLYDDLLFEKCVLPPVVFY